MLSALDTISFRRFGGLGSWDVDSLEPLSSLLFSILIFYGGVVGMDGYVYDYDYDVEGLGLVVCM